MWKILREKIKNKLTFPLIVIFFSLIVLKERTHGVKIQTLKRIRNKNNYPKYFMQITTDHSIP